MTKRTLNTHIKTDSTIKSAFSYLFAIRPILRAIIIVTR